MAKHQLTKKEASFCWNMRQTHDGYVEDGPEWMDCFDISSDMMRAFECGVADWIESLPDE